MSETKLPDMTVKDLDELKLVGFRVVCAGDDYINEIPKASSRLSARMKEIKRIVNPVHQYGAFVVEGDEDDNDGYWVCVEVEEVEDIPPDMVTLTVPPQKYAVTRHRGNNKKIMDAYDELHRWINEHHYTRLKNQWHIEKFNSWMDAENVDVELYDTISD